MQVNHLSIGENWAGGRVAHSVRVKRSLRRGCPIPPGCPVLARFWLGRGHTCENASYDYHPSCLSRRKSTNPLRLCSESPSVCSVSFVVKPTAADLAHVGATSPSTRNLKLET